jgi:EGF-like domain
MPHSARAAAGFYSSFRCTFFSSLAVKCPNRCSGHGQCLTMKQHAARLDKGLQPRHAYYSYSSNWDSEMIHGCSCDEGYAGWDCTERVCPGGDDPMTISQPNEVQLIRCDLDGTDNTLRFTFQYRGATTAPFAPSASAGVVKGLLDSLSTIGSVEVAYGRGFTFCSDEFSSGATPSQPASGNVISITFMTESGDVPSLVILDEKADLLTGAEDNAITIATDGQSLTYTTPSGAAVATAVKGGREWLPCNGRGTCDRDIGQCKCYPGYASSNQNGGLGVMGDCGYATQPITSCPGYPNECSGHGVCSGNPSYKCTCFEGWGGGDCSEQQCPKGPAWFDYPVANNVAHSLAECSNKGRCDRTSGKCQCQNMFEGEACERMTCPGTTGSGPNQQVCSGHGRCLSMTDLAPYATSNGDSTPYTYGNNPNNVKTWDGKMIHGCLCDDGFTGHDCSQRTCPFGEDITSQEWDLTRKNEVQQLKCILISNNGSPSFKLRFRQAETVPISATATVEEVTKALEDLTTIGKITVSFGTSNPVITTACRASPGTIITFSFETEHGDVPPLQVVMDESSKDLSGQYARGDGWSSVNLEFHGGNPANAYALPLTQYANPYHPKGVRAAEVMKGKSASQECSGRGICDRSSGICKCFPGYGPSNGNRGPGLIEDCGWREPFQAQDEGKDSYQNIYAGVALS